MNEQRRWELWACGCGVICEARGAQDEPLPQAFCDGGAIDPDPKVLLENGPGKHQPAPMRKISVLPVADYERVEVALRECRNWIEHRAGPNPEPADQARLDLADAALPEPTPPDE